MEFSDSYNEQLYREPSEEYLDGLRTTLSKADPDAIRSAASIETLEDLIQHCLDTNKNAEALRFADALSAFIPYSGEVWQRRGAALHALEREDEAKESFARALALSPADEELLVQVAETYCDCGDFETAHIYLDRALALNPANEDALWNKALMLERGGSTDEAASLFRTFERSERYGALALSELAGCSNSVEDFERAVTCYEKNISDDPFNEEIWHSLGLLYTRRKMYQKAIEQFDMALAIKDDFAPAWFNRGNALALIDKLSDAIESYKSGLIHEPHDIPALHNMGNTYLEMGRTRDALRYFSLALKFQPENVESLYGRGCCYDELGQYEKALSDFDQALSLDNSDAEIWYAKADVEYNLGRIKSSLLSYHIAAEKNPEDMECAFDYAETLCEDGGFAQALPLFERCCAFDPNWSEAHLGRAKALLGMNRIEESLVILKEAFNINPSLKQQFKSEYPDFLAYKQIRAMLGE